MMDRDLQAPYQLPSDARQVTLVRHGAAAHEWGIATALGQADPDLTALGTVQAEAVARRLAARQEAANTRLNGSEGQPPTLFTTGMRRTIASAWPTAATLGADVHTVPELREVALGAYEGAAWEDARAAADPLLARVFTDERWDVLPGAEPRDQFSRRVAKGLDQVAAAVEPGGHAIVFTHGGVIAELCHQVTRSRPFAFVDVDNASITTLVLTGGNAWVLRGFNDTAHLETNASPAG